SKQQDILEILGATYAAVFFLGAANAITVQPVVAIERTVFYRERAAGMYSALAFAFAQLIPVWWRWYYWGDPVSWTIYGILASQLGTKDDLVAIPGAGSLTVKQFLKDNLGFQHSFLGYVVLAHLGFVLLFFLIFSYSIKHLNFQKR
ncbi:hypothetical protein BHE74_00058885, partial [Ensete ventricosum]